MIKDSVLVSIPQTTKKCFLFWNGGNWETTSNIFSAERIGLLQYIPLNISSNVLSEIYELGENLIEYESFTLTYEYDPDIITLIDVNVSKDGGSTWIKTVEGVIADGTATFSLLQSDEFGVGDNLLIRVSDYYNPLVFGETTTTII